MAYHPILIVIPARYASARFSGKPLAPMSANGHTRPLIEWTWRAAMRCAWVGDIVVATDDSRIADVVAGFGGSVCMTGPTARNGTERCAEVVAAMDEQPELVINLQGDSPLIQAQDVRALIEAWREGKAGVVTPYLLCDAALERRLIDEETRGRVGGTTLVDDRNGRALYFSKRIIPHRPGNQPPLKMHVGLYAYTPDALARYAAAEPSALELAEGLEQLRFLDISVPIDTVQLADRAGGIWEVNNPEDVPIVERQLELGA